jgi:salicylate hydroxylase
MAYPIRAHQLYNMVLCHPTRPDVVESWTSAGPRKFMDEFYANWNPRLNKLLKMVDGDMIPEWNLRIHKPLATWVDGRVALLGDACHSTLPYVSQGAAQACEDAGVLAAALSMCETYEHSELDTRSVWLCH